MEALSLHFHLKRDLKYNVWIQMIYLGAAMLTFWLWHDQFFREWRPTVAWKRPVELQEAPLPRQRWGEIVVEAGLCKLTTLLKNNLVHSQAKFQKWADGKIVTKCSCLISHSKGGQIVCIQTINSQLCFRQHNDFKMALDLRPVKLPRHGWETWHRGGDDVNFAEGQTSNHSHSHQWTIQSLQ